MAMERVTVEQNGERFTLEVAEGTSDDEIRAFLSQQTGSGTTTAPEPQVTENVGVYAAQSALPAAIGGPQYNVSQAARNLQSGLINAGISPGPMPNMSQTVKPGVGPGNAADIAKRLYSLKDLSLSGALKDVGQRGLTQSATDLARFVTEPLGGRVTVGQAMTGLPKALAAGAMAPENLFTLPYNMAAYEQAKIRANPNAPGLEFNPYAQTVRGEIGKQAPSTMVARQQVGTQNMAGAANQMRTVANQPFGNVNAQERAVLEEDRRMRENIRKKAYQKVMGPVAPGSF
jgi:hypothetical protein